MSRFSSCLKPGTTLAIATLLLATPFLTPMADASGYYYEAVTRTQGTGARLSKKAKKQGRSIDSKVIAWVDGAKARVEFEEGDRSGFMTPGSYLVTTDAGETLYLVDPRKKTYSELDFGDLFAAVGGLMDGMFKMEFSDVSNERTLEEPGGRILGYATTHYRYESGYTMTMSVMGMKQKNRNDMVNDFWCTRELDMAGLYVWLRPDKFRTGNEEFDKLLASDYGSMQGCLPLRMETVGTNTDKKGRAMNTTMRTDVVVLRPETPPAGAFEIPGDYQEKPFAPPGMAGKGGLKGLLGKGKKG